MNRRAFLTGLFATPTAVLHHSVEAVTSKI